MATLTRALFRGAATTTVGTYAGVGYSYNEAEDIFITPQPYPSWVRTGSFWAAPVSMPTDGAMYFWDEETLAWVESDLPA